MPGFLGGNRAAAGAPPAGGGFKNFAIQAAPLFSAMAAGYSSGRGPYAYLDQGIAGIQAMQKAKRDEEAAAAASAAFGGLVPGGMGAAGGGSRFTPSGPPLPPPDPNSPHALGNDAMAALGKPAMATAADPASIKAGLVARGLPEHIADGFVMNFEDESGLNPGINEANPTVPGSRGGFGLYQLTGPRRTAYETYAAERGVPVSDVDAQLDFMMAELQGTEAGAWGKISGAKNAGEAGAAIVDHFLRPAEEHRAARSAKYLGADAGPTDPLADPYVQKMMEVMAMPGLTPEQKGVVELQLQTRMGQLTAATSEPVKLQTFTGPDGVVYKFDPVNGTAEPMTGAENEPRPMTVQERAAWGIPETDKTPYKMTDTGPVAIGGGGVTVNNDMGGGKFEEAFAKEDATTIETVYNAGLQAERNLGRIDQLEGLLAASPTGMEGAIKQAAGEWGLATEGLDAIQSAQALVNSLVPEQRQIGSGPMSDADLALFKQSLPRIINQPGGNKIIIDTMRAIAKYDAEGARIVQKLRNGELTRAGAFEALQNRANPLSDYSAGNSGAPQDGAVKPIAGKSSTGVEWSIKP